MDRSLPPKKAWLAFEHGEATPLEAKLNDAAANAMEDNLPPKKRWLRAENAGRSAQQNPVPSTVANVQEGLDIDVLSRHFARSMTTKIRPEPAAPKHESTTRPCAEADCPCPSTAPDTADPTSTTPPNKVSLCDVAPDLRTHTQRSATYMHKRFSRPIRVPNSGECKRPTSTDNVCHPTSPEGLTCCGTIRSTFKESASTFPEQSGRPTMRMYKRGALHSAGEHRYLSKRSIQCSEDDQKDHKGSRRNLFSPWPSDNLEDIATVLEPGPYMYGPYYLYGPIVN